jgi:hypothetical protein
VAKHSLRDRSLELERTTKDDEAVQYLLIDAKKGLKGLHVAVVLPKGVLKLEPPPEVSRRPIRGVGVGEDPARPILQFNDEDAKLGYNELVNLRCAARAWNDNPPKMVIV